MDKDILEKFFIRILIGANHKTSEEQMDLMDPVANLQRCSAAAKSSDLKNIQYVTMSFFKCRMPNSDHEEQRQHQQNSQKQHPIQSKMMMMPRAQSHPTDVPSRPYAYGMHMPSYPSRRAMGVRSGSVSSGGRSHLSSESSISSDISSNSSSSSSSASSSPTPDSCDVVHTKPSSFRNWWCSSCRRPREECECLCAIS